METYKQMKAFIFEIKLSTERINDHKLITYIQVSILQILFIITDKLRGNNTFILTFITLCMRVHRCLCKHAHKVDTKGAVEQYKANNIFIKMSSTDSLYTL
jgi:hypothetical protein